LAGAPHRRLMRKRELSRGHQRSLVFNEY
jgi:hypothetical protein